MPPLEASDVGQRRLLVGLDVEKKGHVDVDALARELLDRRQAFGRARNLDHRIGPAKAAKEAQPLGGRALVVAGEVGRYLEAREAVAGLPLVVQRPQDVGRHADVVDGEVEKDRLRIPLARGYEGAQSVVVVNGAGDRLVQDRRIRGNAGDGVVVDEALEAAGGDEASAYVIEPGALAVVAQLKQRVHLASFLGSTIGWAAQQ